MIFPTVLPSLFSSPWRQIPSCTSTSSPRTSCHALEASSTTSPSTSPTRTVRASLPTSATAIEESLWCLVLRRTGDESCNLFWRLASFGSQTNIKNSITGLNLKPKHCQRHYGPRRWLLWPVILVWKVWFSMLDRLSLILLVGSVGRFGLVVLDW